MSEHATFSRNSGLLRSAAEHQNLSLLQSSPHITWGEPSSPHGLHNSITTPHGHNHLNAHKKLGKKSDLGMFSSFSIRYRAVTMGYLNKLISTLLSGASTTNQPRLLSAHVQARFGICTCHRQSDLSQPFLANNVVLFRAVAEAYRSLPITSSSC